MNCPLRARGGGAVDSPPPCRRPDHAPQASAAPERSLTQRMDALQRPTISAGAGAAQARPQGRTHSIHTLLIAPPEFLETAKVLDMLLAVPKYGRVKANQVLQ